MFRKGDHEAVDALLPWFVNGSLGSREERRVMDHLRECADCRAERDRLQDLQQFVLEEAEADVADYRFGFSQLMQRIDVHEANVESMRDVHRDRGWQRGGWFAAAACLVGALAFVITLNPATDEIEPGFRTLTTVPVTGRSTAAAASTAYRLSLAFDTPDAVRAALIETRASIIAGPDDAGTYLVEIHAPASMTPDALIEGLRAVEGIRYAAFQESGEHAGDARP